MNFNEAQREYERLKRSYQEGLIGPDLFQKAVKNLVVIDEDGHGWQIGVNSGQWYRRDEELGWVEDEPKALKQDAAEPPETLDILNIPLGPPERLETAAVPAAAPAAVPAEKKKPLPNWIWIPAVGGLLVIIMGCFALLGGTALFGGLLAANALPLEPQAPTQTAVPSRTPTITRTPRPSRTPTRTPGPTKTPRPTRLPSLTATTSSGIPGGVSGEPLLLMKDEDNRLWASAQDGSRIVLIEDQEVVAPNNLSLAASPEGGRIAYVAVDEDATTYSLLLKIVQLPENRLLKEISLISPDIPEGEGDENRSPEAVRAITEQESLAWSPDGESLAFIGIMDDVSADLYLYSLEFDEVTRLTSEPSQAYAPSWSEENRFIVYFGADNFGLDGDFEMTRAWAARPSASGGVVDLYEPDSGGENLIGWTDLRYFVVSSQLEDCGNYDLRLINAETSEQTSLYEGCFDQAALDPETGSVMFAISDANATGCLCQEEDGEPGLFLIPNGKGLPRRIKEDSMLEVKWQLEARLFFAFQEDGTGVAFNTDEEEIDLLEALNDIFPTVEPVSGWWAWDRTEDADEPGIWVGDLLDRTPRQIFEDGAELPRWSVDGDTLLFTSQESFYAANDPDFEAILLEDFDSPIEQAVWVQP